LPSGLLKELRDCEMLVLLCSETANHSKSVHRELKDFVEAKGTT
jgi:hypothetical protein